MLQPNIVANSVNVSKIEKTCPDDCPNLAIFCDISPAYRARFRVGEVDPVSRSSDSHRLREESAVIISIANVFPTRSAVHPGLSRRNIDGPYLMRARHGHEKL